MRIRGIALTVCAFLIVGLVATTAGASNDADFAKQWSLAKIHAPEAWDITTGSASNTSTPAPPRCATSSNSTRPP